MTKRAKPPEMHGSRSREKTRGATLVEFALIASLLFFMIFFIIEGAFAVRARNTMALALDEAARRGAVAASDPGADHQIVQQLLGRGAQGVADIEYIVVFKADSSGAIPTACAPPAGGGLPAGAVDECNVYTPDTFLLDAGSFSCPGISANWCPTDRGGGEALEFIGVYAQAEYLPIIPGTARFNLVTVSGSSVEPIETSGRQTS